jgi:hypothetical protein
MSRPPQLQWNGLQDARRFQRVPASASATLMSTALGRIAVPVLDLSQGGCRTRTSIRCREGDRFVLKLDGIGPRAVTVAWRTEDQAGSAEMGLAFAEPIAWSVVQGIAIGR